MRKHYLKLIAVMLSLTFGLSSQVKADYVTSITSGNYYRIVSAYSGLTDKVVMYATNDGMKYKVYDEASDAMDGTMVFQITADGKFKNYDAYNIKSIVGDLYMYHASLQWGRGYSETNTTTNSGYYIQTTTTPWKQCIGPISGNQFIVQPAHDTGSTLAQCSSLNGTATSGNVVLNGWSNDNTYDNSGMANQTNAWQFEEVNQDIVDAIIAANDPLATSLETFLADYNTLVSSTQVGYYVKANVDDFKAYYETCQTAYNSGNNALTRAEKQVYADNLSAKHATAIGTYNELTEGYYVIKSAASAFGSNEYAMYIDDGGNVAWGAYNESALGQFVFQLTDLHQTATPDGVTYEKFSFYSPYQKKYIGRATTQMATEDAKTSDESWGVVCQRQNTMPQFTIQPMWNTSGTASYCLIVDNTSKTSGVIRTSGWYNSTGGTSRSWTFTAIDEADALAAVASMDALKNALDNYASAYASLTSNDNPGEYVKANVEAFKVAYAEANSAYNNGSNSLTNTEKSTYASSLASAYNTAISTTNELTDGYYAIFSTAAAFGNTKYALYINDEGTFGWMEYDENDYKPFVFKVEDLGTTYYFDSQQHKQFSMQNVLSGWYIGSGDMTQNSAGMGVDGTSYASAWPICITYSSAIPQFVLQPMRDTSYGGSQGVSQCIAVDNTSNTSGTIRQSTWLSYSADGTAACWKFEKVEPFAIPDNGTATVYADDAVTVSDIQEALDGLTYSSIDLTGVTLDASVTSADITVLLSGNQIAYVPASSSITGVNIVKDGTCQQLILTDGQSFAAPIYFTATSATYSRTMANEWGTVCLPYDVSSNTNTEYYNITGVENGSLVVEKVDNLSAGTPALVHKVSGEGIIAAATNAPVSATINGVSGAVNMYGTYERTQVTDANAYYIKDNKFWQCNNFFYCGAFRAYFTVSGGSTSPFFDIVLNDDDPTAVASATAGVDAADAAGIYGVDGKRYSTLQQGVNIIKMADGTTVKIIKK